MGLELDWLEREERYRRRVVRLMIAGVVLVAAFIATVAFLRTKDSKDASLQVTRAAEEARLAALKKGRDAFVADSSATANRYSGFLSTHGATPVEGTNLIQIPLPPGTAIVPFLQQLWTEYAHVADPQVSTAQEYDWYRQYYVDVMNDGPLRPRALLLPVMKQEGLKLSMQKPSFSEITLAQVTVGMREPVVEAPMDSTFVGSTSETPSAPEPEPTPAPTPPPTPAPADTPAAPPPDTAKPLPPDEPVPDEPVPDEPSPTPPPRDSLPKG